jgi:PAT family beta-lactamase induction signal transducer AmpG
MTPDERTHQLLLGGLCAAALIPIWLGVKRATHATPMANAFVSYIRQPGFIAILGFIVFYRFGEAMIFSMTKLFMLDPVDKGGLGVTVRDYSLINGFGQVGGLIVGGLLGGWFISRVGLRRAFWPLVFCMHTPNLLYVWLAYAQPANQLLLYPVVFVEAAGYGFGFAGYFVYLMHIAQRDKGPESPAGKFTTSHYAIGTGLGALFITFATISGGIIQSVFGYLGVFIGACIFTIPGTLILLVIPMDKSEGRGIKAEAE